MLPPLIFGGILIRSKLSIFLAISICCVLAFAQSTQKPAQPTAPASNEAKSPAPSPQSESAVPAEAPVITINGASAGTADRSEEHTSELQSRFDIVCRP